jgi:hypothetical protein
MRLSTWKADKYKVDPGPNRKFIGVWSRLVVGGGFFFFGGGGELLGPVIFRTFKNCLGFLLIIFKLQRVGYDFNF